PLTENRSGLTACLERLRDGQFLVADAHLRFWSECAEQADAIGVAPSQQRGARRRANGLPDVKIGETHSLARHAIEVGCFDIRRTKTADVLITLVVGENDDEVWPLRQGGGEPDRAGKRQGNDQADGFGGSVGVHVKNLAEAERPPSRYDRKVSLKCSGRLLEVSD